MSKNMKETQFKEATAMYRLKTIDNERFGGLKLSDRPDLQNSEKSLGIEVTSGIKQTFQENAGGVKREVSKILAELGTSPGPNEAAIKIHECLREKNITTAFWGDLNAPKIILDKKLEKMNVPEFKQFENLMLYIEVLDFENYEFENFRKLLQTNIVSITKAVPNLKKIFIDNDQEIIEINLYSNLDYVTHNLTNEELAECTSLAREYIENLNQ
ncbi:hypothetical protein [Aerococcus sp. UMB7834]|uniref:hypothetical protein n=1 Tax=Aerococcus sp. UMB7834 TaxID=3046342 RepID=UPI0025503B8B|nr:hypothetical protein [Aerococcus sp. UMB7834]MDK6805119.1 hypothetical protein [Aerococcus sp. UMB7834]